VFKSTYAGGQSRKDILQVGSNSVWSWGRWSSCSCTCWDLHDPTCTPGLPWSRRSEMEI